MKKADVSVRKVACRGVVALGCFVFIQLVGARDAHAESPRKVEGFEALGTLGYGVALWDDDFDPYGVMVGVELGYTLPFGLRIGADASYGFGRRSEVTRSTGEKVETDADSFAFGGSAGYDLLLPFFRLRGALDMGLALYSSDTGRVRIEGAYVPGAAWYIGPKVALIWQYRTFELGLQSRYLVTGADVPGNDGVVQVGLMCGARF